MDDEGDVQDETDADKPASSTDGAEPGVVYLVVREPLRPGIWVARAAAILVGAATLVLAIAGLMFGAWEFSNIRGVEDMNAAQQRQTKFVGCHVDRPAQPYGSYPGGARSDCIADAGGVVRLSGLTITATNFERRIDPVTQKRVICARVAFTDSNERHGYGPQQFAIASPGGATEAAIESNELPGIADYLGTGQIFPGGSVSGTICGRDTGQSGQYALIWPHAGIGYTANLPESTRAVWPFKL